jgi:glucosamine kinase
VSPTTATERGDVLPTPSTPTVLAVDGGGSGIRVGVAGGASRTSRARSVGEDASTGLAGAVTIAEVDPVRRGGDAAELVAAAVTDGWRRIGSPDVDRVVLGLTTAPADPDAADRLARLVAESTGTTEVWVADDAVTTHAGALSMGWGVSVTAGTGVACCAMPRSGEPRIVAGYGFLLGDEGGAYWIGREGLRRVLRGRDGRAAPTGLAAAAVRRFGNLDDVHVRLHDDPGAVDAIARFAQDVLDAAGSGLAAPSAIVDEAARELLLLAAAAAAHAGATSDDPAPLALGGRVLEPGTPLRRRLEERIRLDAAPVSPRSADATPLHGALLLGAGADPGRYASLVRVWRAPGRPA